jgi:hypothetical protein
LIEQMTSALPGMLLHTLPCTPAAPQAAGSRLLLLAAVAAEPPLLLLPLLLRVGGWPLLCRSLPQVLGAAAAVGVWGQPARLVLGVLQALLGWAPPMLAEQLQAGSNATSAVQFKDGKQCASAGAA